jgi:hypothetical protein
MAFEGAETASESHTGRHRPTVLARRLGSFLRRHAATIATVIAVLGGLLLLYAETLDLYRIITPSGSTSNASGSIRTGSDQHAWALGIVGVAGAGAAIGARVTRQRLPALAAAVLGAIALVVVLAVDLPDVTAAGVTTDLEIGDAEPAAGFWLELAGALVLIGGAALLASMPAASRPATRPRR